MAHGVEFRVPFLASTLSQMLLAQRRWPDKQLLRELLLYYRAPERTISIGKFGKAERALAASMGMS
jgi:hypothetical protein